MRRPPSSTLRGGTSLEHTPGTRSALGRAAVLCLLLLQLVGTTSPAMSGSGVAVGLCILNLLSIASASSPSTVDLSELYQSLGSGANFTGSTPLPAELSPLVRYTCCSRVQLTTLRLAPWLLTLGCSL